ncbi:MFS transporter [Nonomuraea aridisoli]|uniref:MFS transporter n=1 Tax=Nonomuraea aridisoli TaxID=2070368 RepID=A0A2W2EP78_9ACTN|nr:MFS transporter [Nonomuraea aridisoli]PZG18395.1 MFS transporter [Nonomuraea aridisoli]
MASSPTLLQNRNFRRLLAADAISHAGTQITSVALPLTAVVALQAGALDTGLLNAAQQAAFLLLGLPAGVWVDRLRRRPILVTTDLARAALLLTLPVAWWLDLLTLPHLYVVAFGLSAATVFFDVAYRSYLPTLLDKDQLVRGNGAIESVAGLSRVAGPGVGGWAVQLVGGPVALLADAFSYLASALCLRGIDAHEALEDRPAERRALSGEIWEGVTFVLRDPALRAIATSAAVSNFCGAAIAVLQVLFLIRTVGISPGLYGMLLMAGAAGGLVAAVTSGRLAGRIGQARLIWLAPTVCTPFALLIPFTGAGWELSWFVVATLMTATGGVLFNVAQASYRQAISPDHLLGRVTASTRFIAWGVLPFGATAGGLLGELYSTRDGLWVVALAQLLSLAPLLLSPLRRMRNF